MAFKLTLSILIQENLSCQDARKAPCFSYGHESAGNNNILKLSLERHPSLVRVLSSMDERFKVKIKLRGMCVETSLFLETERLVRLR
jgi:hypothetical protein